jgi:hypothetical protein
VLKDNTEIGVHKAILAARSDYFMKSMYGRDFASSQAARDGKFDASEFTPDAFVTFLKLLYSDDANYLSGKPVDCVLEVLKIADMYGVTSVATHCDNNLAHGNLLTVETCGELLAMATKMNWTSIRKSAMEFFKRNREKVLETTGFHTCVAENPALVIELMRMPRV